MNNALEQEIWRRALGRCEYCQMPHHLYPTPFQIDHIIARQHGGETTLENLALSCFRCNTYKGPNIAGLDPATGLLVPLFHPRRDQWADHFEWYGPMLVGRTPIGRTTIRVLAINHPDYVAVRASLIAERRFPSDLP